MTGSGEFGHGWMARPDLCRGRCGFYGRALLRSLRTAATKGLAVRSISASAVKGPAPKRIEAPASAAGMPGAFTDWRPGCVEGRAIVVGPEELQARERLVQGGAVQAGRPRRRVAISLKYRLVMSRFHGKLSWCRCRCR